MNRHLRNVLILKGVIGIGLLASYCLPPQHAVPVGIVANLLWLWKA